MGDANSRAGAEDYTRRGQEQLPRIATKLKQNRESSFVYISKASQGQTIPTCAAFVVGWHYYRRRERKSWGGLCASWSVNNDVGPCVRAARLVH